MNTITKRTRGRPKTLDRSHVLQTALTRYWDEGPTSVSIGDLCEAAGVSKPGLYREFGSDDGLKVAVLEHYHDVVLTPMYAILSSDKPFVDVIQDFINFVAQDRRAIGVPPGCLQVSMRAHRNELGEMTGKKVDGLRQKTLSKYEELIESAKAKGEIGSNISSKVGALLLDAQNASAMGMQREGVPNETIKTVMLHALSGLR